MMTPKAKAEQRLWELQLEVAVTYPIDHEAIRELVSGLTTEEIAAIPYLPNREEYLSNV